MRTEISQAKRENTHYLQNVEKGKEIQAIVERKRKRGASEDEVECVNILRVYLQLELGIHACRSAGNSVLLESLVAMEKLPTALCSRLQ